nr:Smr/MutS family protein [Sphingomonas colocasiae]
MWARVIASVTPIAGRADATAPVEPAGTVAPVRRKAAPLERHAFVADVNPRGEKAAPASANTLDGGWDRRLRRGVIDPDMTVDLHGHTLDSAWRMLDSSLARAITGGTRVILLVTGKPPRGDRRGRGAIRGVVGDWLASSRHAGRIAAVRNAHPRHGGSGALYIILKRDRLTS